MPLDHGHASAGAQTVMTRGLPGAFPAMMRVFTTRMEYLFAGLLAFLCIAFGKQMVEAPLYAVAVIGLIAAMAVMVSNARWSLYIAACILIAIEEFDLTSTEAYFSVGGSQSIMSMRLFGVSFMDAFTLLFFLPVLLREWHHWRETGRWRVLPLDGYWVPILAVYLFGTLTGMFNAPSFGDLTWESRNAWHIASWYFIASRCLRTRRDVLVMLMLMFATFNLKSILFLYRLATGQGLHYGYDFYRPALGADVPLMAVTFIVVLTATLILKKSRPWHYALALLVTAYWCIWFVSSLGRASYITAMFALVFVLFITRKGLDRKFLWAVAGTAVVAGFGYYYFLLDAVKRELVGLSISTAFNWVDAITLYSDMSIGQRIMELINISETLTRAGAWLWGLGWGAPWSEVLIKHPIDIASFEYMESIRGVHTMAHLDFVYFLLKVGIVGTVILYAGLFAFVVQAVRFVKREQAPAMKLMLLALLVMLLVFIPNFIYFYRLKLLLGITFGCLSMLWPFYRVSSAAAADAS